MSFVLYDIIFLIIFGLFLTIFLIKRKEKLKREGILILYRTRLGIRVINYISKKYKKFLNGFEYVLIFAGYSLMLGMLYLLFKVSYLFVKSPDLFKVIKIPPIAPLIPYLPQIFKVDYLPPFYFTYWIIVLAIAATTHEFLHGIFAKARGIEIKSTGFAFLGPFTGAFVEPDEKKVKKLKIRNQLGFLAAGSFANLIMTVLFFFILWIFFISVFSPQGVVFGSYTFSIVNSSMIESISNESFSINFDGGLNLTKVIINNTNYYVRTEILENLSSRDLIVAYENTPALNAGLAGIIVEFDGEKIRTNNDLKILLSNKKPGEEVLIETLFNGSLKEYKINLAARPDNISEAYLGISPFIIGSQGLVRELRDRILFFRDPYTYYEPIFAKEFTIFIYNLLWWIILVNFSVALSNMLPLGIFDGGRIFYLTMLGITKSEKIAKKAFKFSTYFILFIFLLLTFMWLISLIT